MATSIAQAGTVAAKPAANGKLAAKAAVHGKPVAKGKPAAKGKGTNRSQAIRDELAKNPKATSKEIIAALKGKGIKVKSSLIYFVKAQQHKAKRTAKRARVTAEVLRTTPTSNAVELVLRVKDLAREVGGIANLKKLVHLLAE
jgi:hypothetical protein